MMHKVAWREGWPVRRRLLPRAALPTLSMHKRIQSCFSQLFFYRRYTRGQNPDFCHFFLIWSKYNRMHSCFFCCNFSSFVVAQEDRVAQPAAALALGCEEMESEWRDENEEMERKWRDENEEIKRKWRDENEEMKGKWRENEEMKRKWRENEEMKRKWRENEEMKRKWRENEETKRKWRENEDIEVLTFYISLFPLNFLHQNLSYFVAIYGLLSRMSQKS